MVDKIGSVLHFLGTSHRSLSWLCSSCSH